jgi:hypothetical protein
VNHVYLVLCVIDAVFSVNLICFYCHIVLDMNVTCAVGVRKIKVN